MTDDLAVLIDRIRLLLNGGGSRASDLPLEVVEHTLTDGYARALALEGERLKAEELIRELAGNAEHAPELRALKRRVHALDSELAQLRGLLKGLAATL
jgi:hypothetical protein